MKLRVLYVPALAVVFLAAVGAGMASCTETPIAPANLALNNTDPVARVAEGGEAAIGAPLALDGTASYDPDGDEIVFIWSVDSKPEISVMGENPFSANEDRNAGLVTVTLDVEGVYIFALAVEDPSGARSDSDYVVYEAVPGLELPLADAGPNATGLEGSEVCLDGSNSHDPGGLELAYTWALVSIPEHSQLSTADVTPSGDGACFTPDAPGSYAVALTVNNGLVDSEPDFAFVAAGSTNQGPEAIAGVVSAASCDFIVLTGVDSSDPEGDVLYYNWDLLATPPGSIAALGQDAFEDPLAEEARFYADVEGEYTLQLVVNDGEDYSTPVFIDVDVVMTTVNNPPLLGTSPDAYYYSPSPTCSTDAYGNCTNCPNCGSIIVPMDAVDTTDPDGDLLTITWEIVTSPGGAQLEFEEGWYNELTLPGPPGTCTTTINTYDAQVEVTATDCVGDSASSLITVVYDCGG
jgi:hypothetical protein